MFVADECVAAVRGRWLFGWCAPPSPGIPRSHNFARSRPFRCAKGAWVVLVQRVGGEGVCWWFGVGRAVREPPLRVGWLVAWMERVGCCCCGGGAAPLRPGHPPRAAFRRQAYRSRGEGEGWEAHTNAGFGRLRYSPEPIASVWREE